MDAPENSEEAKCFECGQVLSGGTLGGMCPRCLASYATDGDEDTYPPGTMIRYFGDFELEEEIGRGGVGVVYRARQLSLDRLVAVKMLLSAELANRETVQRFRLEARAAAKLDHEGIVPIYETGEHEMQNYYVMKFVDGGRNILDLPKKEDPVVVAQAVRKVAQALEYAHSMGVLHRDLKPSNILLNDDDEPMLTDFGLAKLLENDAGLTRPSSMLGTPQYLSPEVAKEGFKSVTKKVDVYGIGVVLYELLTGRPPFSGGKPTEIVERVISDEVKFASDQDEDLQLICLKCLAKDPNERYESAQEVADELGRYLNGEPLLIRPRGRIGTLQRWVRSHPVKCGLVLLSSLLLFGAVHGIDRYLDSRHPWQDNFGIAMDTDGSLLAIGDVNSPAGVFQGGSVTVVDADSLSELKVFYPSQSQQKARYGWGLAIDGRWLAVGASSDSKDLLAGGAVSLYDLESKDGAVRELRPPEPGWRFAFGSWVDIKEGIVAIHEHQGGGGSGEVYLFDAESGELLSRLAPEEEGGKILGKGVKLSGKRLVLPTYSKSERHGEATISVYDISTPKSPKMDYSVKTGEFGLTSKVALRLAVSDSLIAVSSQEGDIFLLELETGKLRTRIPSVGKVKDGTVALSSDFLAVRQPENGGESSRIALYQVEDGKLVHAISCPEGKDAATFGRTLSIADDFLYVGAKSLTKGNNGRTPVFRYRLSDGQLDRELVASRKTAFEKQVFRSLTIVSLAGPPFFMVVMVLRKRRSR